MSAKFKAESFVGHYHTALRDLIQQKMKGRVIKAPPASCEGGVAIAIYSYEPCGSARASVRIAQ
jgi:hypothetical protein